MRKRGKPNQNPDPICVGLKSAQQGRALGIKSSRTVYLLYVPNRPDESLTYRALKHFMIEERHVVHTVQAMYSYIA